jgi:hypothetical protein
MLAYDPQWPWRDFNKLVNRTFLNSPGKADVIAVVDQRLADIGLELRRMPSN